MRNKEELDKVLENMETTEEGRATELGWVYEMRQYGDEPAGER